MSRMSQSTESSQTHPRPKRRTESGVTLLLTLGVLAVMMMIMLSLSMTSIVERKSSTMQSDLLRSRLLAESCVDRALNHITEQFAGDLYPGSSFYDPGDKSDWAGRRFLGSVNGDCTAGIEDALSVTLGSLEFTPAAQMHSSIGWNLVRSTQAKGDTQKGAIIGRYAYSIIDESGKLDPGAVVCTSSRESDKETRLGTSPSEISLADLGITDPDSFRPNTVTNGEPGMMPADGRWFSMGHIARALNPTQAQFDKMTRTLHPFSYDVEQFWRDRNNNGKWDEGEDEDRINLATPLSLEALYTAFVGANKGSTDDDSTWLKEMENNAWFQTWSQSVGLTPAQARRIAAAQVAVNIMDYADPDSDPTPAYVDSEGQIQEGAYAGAFNVRGVEKTWGVSELSLRMETDVHTIGADGGGEAEEDPGTPTTYGITGNININPNNSPHMEFYLIKPDGSQITRDDLHSYAPDYTGGATRIHVKPKGNGNQNGLMVNGELFALQNRNTYDIISNSMTVRLYNDNRKSNGKCMGHWWISVEAIDATIIINDKGYQGGRNVSFTITDGEVVPAERYTASITVLGASIYNWGYNQPTTLKAKVGNDTLEPWGPYSTPVDSNLNDGNNPRTYTLPDTYEANTPIALTVEFWKKRSSYYSGSSNSHWETSREVSSSPANVRCQVLRNGDDVPTVSGFQNQQDIEFYVASYVQDGAMVMTDNQAIYLFEHTSNLSGSGADYQDCVVLVTLAEGEEEDTTTPSGFDFNIANGESTPTGEFFVTATVLGTSITNWGYDQPVTCNIKIGSEVNAPWGSYSSPTAANLNDGNNPRTYEFPNSYPAGTPVSGQVKFWKKKKTNYSGNKDSHWETSREVDSASSSDSARTCVLRDGDNVPSVSGFQNQENVEFYVQDYVVNGKMSLAENQAIYLFEHTSNLSGSGADFQDCVILITMTDAVEARGTPGTDPTNTEAPAVSTGDALRFRAGLKCEVYFPYGPNADQTNPPGDLTVTYTVEVATATGEKERLTTTKKVALDSAENVEGGTLMFTSEYDNDEWTTVADAFDSSVSPARDWYTVTLLQIDRVELRDPSGNVMDLLPGDGTYFCNWAQSDVATDDQLCFASARALDPMMNDRSEQNADFTSFWDVKPDVSEVAKGEENDPSDVGTLTTGGYDSAPYCDVAVKDAPFTRLGELGRVHSYAPMRSLRLWAANSSDEKGHDAGILDLFKTKSGFHTRGKVNINTLNTDVLNALFNGATTVPAERATEAVLEKREGGKVFTSAGDMFGSVSGVTGSDPAQDREEEEALGRLAELLTVRQNYFTIIVCAQSIKDVAGVKYGETSGDRSSWNSPGAATTGEPQIAQLNHFDVEYDNTGKVVRYIDPILAEQKVKVVAYRDAFSNQIRVERLEYLQE